MMKYLKMMEYGNYKIVQELKNIKKGLIYVFLQKLYIFNSLFIVFLMIC